MYQKIASLLIAGTFLTLTGCSEKKETRKKPVHTHTRHTSVVASTKKIQVALLLDTSSSMDGLINQAKARLWEILNTLTTLRYEGKMPVLEIALYEYGNDGLSASSDYIRRITSLTTDMDLISEKLFALHTYGGSEYCGAVINDAVSKLEWTNGTKDMRLVYIAGNEEFNQGERSYIDAVEAARKKDIFINTIYCGMREEGISGLWQRGAELGRGNYFNIDQDAQIAYIETPYDAAINTYNSKLNGSYVAYGAEGEHKKSNQALQDYNAEALSSTVAAERVVTKANSFYKNDSWDLVDKYESDNQSLYSIKKTDLPKSLQSKSDKELKAFVEQKSSERKAIRSEITTLSLKRQQYLATQSRSSGRDHDLGEAIRQSILKFALSRGYSVQR